MTVPVASNQPQSTGRSRDADLIYQQYLAYCSDIDKKINAMDALPPDKRTQANVVNDRNQLITLKQNLFPIFSIQYNNSNSTIDTFIHACSVLEDTVLKNYNDAMGITSATTSPPTSQTTQTLPSPIQVVTTINTPPVVTPPAATSPPATPVVTSTGRSKEADQIYSQYIAYCSDVDAKIGALDGLPYNQRILPQAIQDRASLVALKQQLAPIYQAQYNNSSSTLASFIAACQTIENQVVLAYKDAMSLGSTSPAPVTSPPPVTVPPATSTTSTTPPPSTALPTTSTAPPTTTVQSVQPVTSSSAPGTKIENGAWYINWTSWTYPIPQGVNLVNIFVGNMHTDATGAPVIDGFGTMSQNYPAMDAFIQACHAKGITVKISIGGGGGSYDNCWDVLTNSNVQSFAQAFANFCTVHKLDGVDFDVEEFQSASDKPLQQALAGTLIKDFKAINPNFQTSLCTNAGFGPNFPWPGVVQNILNAAMIVNPATNTKTCAVDKLYIMAYYNSLSEEQGWVTGWANWAKANYGINPSQITVGLNSQSMAYDVPTFAAWAASNGYSTSYWGYDPARLAQSDAQTTAILGAYTTAAKK